jgi:murein DD-endopeptidase MepM/ murein hydrolase activator NlpD
MDFKDQVFKKILAAKNRIPKRTQVILLASGIVILGAVGFGMKVQADQEAADAQHLVDTQGFEVYFEGELVAKVRNAMDVQTIVEEKAMFLEKAEGLPMIPDGEFTYEATHFEDGEETSPVEIQKRLNDAVDYVAEGTQIVVDGIALATVKNEEEAQRIIEEIQAPYIEKMNEEGSEIFEVGLVEDVSFELAAIDPDAIENPETVKEFLVKGTNKNEVYVVKPGDWFEKIAADNDMTISDLKAANPDMNYNLIYAGDEVNLIVPDPFVSVATYEKATYEEDIDYDTEYTTSSSYYKDEYRVVRSGKTGTMEVVANIKKVNGKAVEVEVLEETVLKEPTAKLVAQGTKDIPQLKGTGVFQYPVQVSTLSSRFGNRVHPITGRPDYHTGVDWPKPSGTPVKAADGGTITFAGWKSGYGYCVYIDHGGGFETRYAHLSAIYVKKGEKVYKDKTIGAVGNTGNSTGSHLHFEVRKYGVAYNPYNYLGGSAYR